MPGQGPPPDPAASAVVFSPVDARSLATIDFMEGLRFAVADDAEARPQIAAAEAAGPVPAMADTQIEAWELSLLRVFPDADCATSICTRAEQHPLVYVRAVRWFGPAPDHSTPPGSAPVDRGIEHWFSWAMTDANTGEMLAGGGAS